jgi:DNA recombination protein RmuC
VLRLPNAQAGLVIDAKFPLEAFEALRRARDDAARKAAGRRIRVDVGRHVEAVAARYLIPGETQDMAIIFIPSEAIGATLHEGFDDLVQKAQRARIFFSTPCMLMLAVHTMQAILKDVRMREEASLIQTEVGRMMEDVTRLSRRVEDLGRHLGQAGDAVDQILISTGKVASRGRRIAALEFDGCERAEEKPAHAEIFAGRDGS